MALFGLIVVIAVLVAGRSQAQGSAMQHATGTFQVAVTPADAEVVEGGLGLSRYTLTKTFVGGMSGTGVGQMLAGGPSAEVGSYVALERFVGSLDGREGAFLLAHRGDMDAEGFTLSITIVPNSGTGELAGITGDFDLTIADGEHRYDLSYQLPTR